MMPFSGPGLSPRMSTARVATTCATGPERILHTTPFIRGVDPARIVAPELLVCNTLPSGHLRLLNKAVPSTYGPTADVTWAGADPTQSVEAAGRKTAWEHNNPPGPPRPYERCRKCSAPDERSARLGQRL